MSHADATTRPRRTRRWVLGAAALLVAGLVVVLVVRPLVTPEAGRGDLEREARAVMAPLGLTPTSAEDSSGGWSVGAEGGMTVEATVAGNQQATELVSAEVRRRGWLIVPSSNDLADAVMMVKAVKVVGGRPATVEMIAAMRPVEPGQREATFQASLTFRFAGQR